MAMLNNQGVPFGKVDSRWISNQLETVSSIHQKPSGLSEQFTNLKRLGILACLASVALTENKIPLK